jgi:hypothetical protein
VAGSVQREKRQKGGIKASRTESRIESRTESRMESRS